MWMLFFLFFFILLFLRPIQLCVEQGEWHRDLFLTCCALGIRENQAEAGSRSRGCGGSSLQ